MAFIILALIITIPIVEIALFIELGGWIGLWPTIGCIVATAVIGTVLLRAQGLAVLARARKSLEQEAMPVDAVFDGVCLLVAGALLLTPGFLTDAIGFILLIPSARWAIARRFAAILMAQGTVHGGSAAYRGKTDGNSRGEAHRGSQRPTVIETDYREIDDADAGTDSDAGPPRPDPDSPWSNHDRK